MTEASSRAGRVSWLRAVAVGLSLSICASAGCFHPEVVRVVDGEERRGDFVTPTAYAAYARAAIAEREGRLRDAARDYAIAADDSGDAAAYARLGAVACALGDAEGARRAFEEGLARDAAAAVVHRERARCALGRGSHADAAADAAIAVRVDPDDGDAVMLLTEALRGAGREAEAGSLVAEARAGRAALRNGDHAAGRRADRARAGDGVVLPASAAARGADLAASLRAERPTVADVDDALRRGELDDAAHRATAARLARADLAARALAHGHRAIASTIARRVVAAAPGNATAWCVAAASDDGATDEGALRARLARLPSGTPSPLASLLYAELLLRRGGREAAMAWAPAESLAAPRVDPLEEAVRLRLVAALAR